MHRKGFVPIILIVAVAVILAVAGGVWYYGEHKAVPPHALDATNEPSINVISPPQLVKIKNTVLSMPNVVWTPTQEMTSTQIDIQTASSVYLPEYAANISGEAWKTSIPFPTTEQHAQWGAFVSSFDDLSQNYDEQIGFGHDGSIVIGSTTINPSREEDGPKTFWAYLFPDSGADATTTIVQELTLYIEEVDSEGNQCDPVPSTIHSVAPTCTQSNVIMVWSAPMTVGDILKLPSSTPFPWW